MKTIGLIGGSSWHSSIEYYRIINEETEKRLGGSHSAKCLMYSMDFEDVANMSHEGEWEEISEFMINVSKNLEKGGAELLVICANTMHKCAKAIQKSISIPLLHIAEATANKIKNNGINKVGLLGTKYTMLGDFYRDVLVNDHNIETIVPKRKDVEIINNAIYNELVHGIIKTDTKSAYLEIIEKLNMAGADGIILGCTEIPLIIKQEDCKIPLFDTTEIHAKAAVDLALK